MIHDVHPSHLTEMHQQPSNRVLATRNEDIFALSDAVWHDLIHVVGNGPLHAILGRAGRGNVSRMNEEGLGNEGEL